MQCIIDVTRIFRYRMKNRTLTGIDRVTMAYIEHYQGSAYALVRWCGRSWLLPMKQSQLLFSWIIKPRTRLEAQRILMMGILFSRGLQLNKNIFLLNTGHVAPQHHDYLRLIQRWGVKPIFFVHDLIPTHYPEYWSAGEDKRHEARMAFILKHAHGIITNSHATLEHFRLYCLQKNHSLPQAQVALLASGFNAKPNHHRPIEKPYFVIVSTIEPRKNHLLILHIWRNLCQQLGDQAPHLFVIGKRGWECEQVLDLLERSSWIKNAVTEINHCPDEVLATYIYHSQALLMPTFAEGYGLSLAEAMALNTPVIASDLSVFKEIAGDIPEYINPIDGLGWQACILEYAKPDSLARTSQIKRLQSFHQPHWQDHFRKVHSFLLETNE